MLLQRIDDDLRTAMKASNAETLSVLRLLKSALKNKQIELGHELSDEEVLPVIQKEVKQRRESASEFTKGDRPEMAAKELSEAELLTTYLPAQLSDDELAAIIDQVIAETGAQSMQDMGKVIGAVIGKTQGQADGSRVSSLVKSRLGH